MDEPQTNDDLKSTLPEAPAPVAGLFDKKPVDFKMVSMRLPLALYDRIRTEGLRPRKIFEIGMQYKDEWVLIVRKAELLTDENKMLRAKVVGLERSATMYDAVAMQKSIANLQSIAGSQQERLVKKQEELDLVYEQLAVMRALKEVAKSYKKESEDVSALAEQKKVEEQEVGKNGRDDTEGSTDA